MSLASMPLLRGRTALKSYVPSTACPMVAGPTRADASDLWLTDEGVMDVWRGKQGLSRNPGHVPELMERVRARCRVKHYSLRTEQAYMAWIWRFMRANGGRH